MAHSTKESNSCGVAPHNSLTMNFANGITVTGMAPEGGMSNLVDMMSHMTDAAIVEKMQLKKKVRRLEEALFLSSDQQAA